MTDHIIKAAKAAGGTTYTNRHHDGTACAFGPTALKAFWDAAYRAGMERAAEICEGIADDYEKHEGRKYPEMRSDAQTGASKCEYAIRAEAHAQNQPVGTHKEGA